MKKGLILLILPTLLLLNGCVVGGGEGIRTSWNLDSDEDSSEWEQRQKGNKAIISQLDIGESRLVILKKMGEPDFSESFVEDTKPYQIYYYRTHKNKGDGKTTKDETTALIFADDSLIGWGKRALEQIINL